MRKPFRFEGVEVEAGTAVRIPVQFGLDPLGRQLEIPVHILHGLEDGPILGITSTIHGDELNGVTIIRHLLHGMDLNPGTKDDLVTPETLSGTLIVVPVCNPEAVIIHSRRSSDGRDLNRCFPGTKTGTHSSRLAHTLFHRIVTRCDYLIDLHTAPSERTNAPHVRADCDDSKSKELARAFGTPIVLHSIGPAGSLRRCSTQEGIHAVLLEAGTANVFESGAITAGVRGIMNILVHLEMIQGTIRKPDWRLIVRTSQWIRSPRGGMLHPLIQVGELVDEGQPIAQISNPLSGEVEEILSPLCGVAVGLATAPLLRAGEPVANIASVNKKRMRKRIKDSPMTGWKFEDVAETLEDIAEDADGLPIDEQPED